DVADRVPGLPGDLLDPVPLPVDVVVANLAYLRESAHDPLYEDEPPEAVYAPGDGLDPYRRLLNACREGRLVTPGGKVVLQYHREPLTADCWQLEDLRWSSKRSNWPRRRLRRWRDSFARSSSSTASAPP